MKPLNTIVTVCLRSGQMLFLESGAVSTLLAKPGQSISQGAIAFRTEPGQASRSKLLLLALWEWSSAFTRPNNLAGPCAQMIQRFPRQVLMAT